MKCICENKFAENQNQSYYSVMKTLLLMEQTWGRSKHVCRDDLFLSLAHVDRLFHELIRRAHWAFYWPKYECINLADVWTVNLVVRGTCSDQ